MKTASALRAFGAATTTFALTAGLLFGAGAPTSAATEQPTALDEHQVAQAQVTEPASPSTSSAPSGSPRATGSRTATVSPSAAPSAAPSPSPSVTPSPAPTAVPSVSPQPSPTRTTASPKVLTAGTPTVTGAAVVGSTLTARPGRWTSGAKLSYQWLSDGKVIKNATKSTYKVPSGQVGKRISVRVSGAATGYASAQKTSAATTRVAQAATPTLSGNVRTGGTITAKPGKWTAGTAFTYQWRVEGKVVSRTKSAQYKIRSTDAGKRISVTVVGTKSGHTTVERTSKMSSRPLSTGSPKVSGKAIVGSTLTAQPGKWSSGTSLSYQWFADGKRIKGANKRTYKVSTGQQGKQIAVRVTGKKSGHASAQRNSSKTAKVMRAGTPTISGTAQVGKTLTAKTGTWTSKTSFSYQWFSNGKRIKGATKRTYKVSSGQQGKKISVKVTGKKSGHTTVTKASKATASVTRAPAASSSRSTSSSNAGGRRAPVTSWDCPRNAPIKGNANSGIYHVPSARFYEATKPEDCFATESAARSAGYRKAKV